MPMGYQMWQKSGHAGENRIPYSHVCIAVPIPIGISKMFELLARYGITVSQLELT